MRTRDKDISKKIRRFLNSFVSSLLLVKSLHNKRLYKSLSLAIIWTLVSLGIINFNLSVDARVLDNTALEAKELSAESFMQAGKKYYRSGLFAQAVEQWQRAYNIVKSKGDILNQSAVLSNLALGYQKLGKREEANQAVESSLSILSSLNLNSKEAKSLYAKVLNTQGSLLFSEGKTQKALNVWMDASDRYKKIDDSSGHIRSLLNQSKALRALGLYPRAKSILEEVHQSLEKEPPSLLKASTLLNFGDTLRLTGDLPTSQKVLQESLAIAEKLNSPNNIAAVLLSLGNNAREGNSPDKALEYYQKAIVQSASPTQKLYAQLNQLHLLADMEKWQQMGELVAEIEGNIKKLPPSRQSVYTKVNFAQSLIKIPDESGNYQNNYQETAGILAKAIQEAETIDDARAQSYANGYLGELYEKTQQLSEAQKLTEKALMLSQASNAKDISYRWQWQLGRLLKKQNQTDKAIASYSEAVNTLNFIRDDLAVSDVNVQFSFRESVEPVYRELVSLLLRSPTSEESASLKDNKQANKETNQVTQSNLRKAREVIESLQLAELDNYFREACLTGNPAQIDKIDSQAAIIYPIILPDRLEVVLSLPDKTLHHYPSKISKSELEKIMQKMRRSLRRTSLKKERLAIAQKMYDLIVKPIEPQLKSNDIKTLAFVLDGSMKSLPMSALYDGESKQYLIQKYGLALTPGLQLFDPKPIENDDLKVLAGGLSESRQGFMSLPGVTAEINKIRSEINSQVLLDKTFTTKSLQKQINKTPFPVVHLATHGQFSSSAKDTFILTWDNRIDVKQLGELLQQRETYSKNPIELLVLSACQTAQGDKRAALGLAGVAVRSGARSTLASLWSVDDGSTSTFMVEFYKQLSQPNISKAEALRQAQISLLNQRGFKHPFYWAPFVLVGNWL